MFTDKEIRELKSLVYYNGAGFVDFPIFFNRIREKLDTSVDSNKLVQIELDRLLRLKNDALFLNAIYDSTEHFENSFQRIGNLVNDFFGGEVKMPKLFIVDKLPGRYSSKPWTAMFIDNQDSDRLGFDAGIYYIKSVLTHPFFEFIVAHELVHWVISHYSIVNHPHSNLLEEGLCDLFSYIILLNAEVVSNENVSNFLIYNRSLSHSGTLWFNYFKFSKLMLQYSCKDGVQGLINLIRKGRSALNAIPSSFPFSIPSDSTIIKILTIFNESESIIIVSAEQYMILKYLAEHKIQYFNADEIALAFPSILHLGQFLDQMSDLSLIASHEVGYYSSIQELPKNLKFKIT